MTNSIVPFNPASFGITVEGLDGQTYTVDPSKLADMLPGGGGGKPLPRIIAVQPRDNRDGIPVEWRDQLAMQISENAVDDNGESSRFKSFAGPFGKSLTVRVVGFTMNRSFMPKYDPNAPEGSNKPNCRSENFVAPDAAYMGKFSTQCCAVNPQTGKLVPICPMAQWGEKINGKSNPPSCNETYVIAVAFEHEGEWVIAECYLKSASANSGKTLIQQLRGLQIKNLPFYTFPVELRLTEAGVGNTYVAVMQIPQPGQEDQAFPEEHEIDVLEAGVARWQEAMKVRSDRAQRVSDTAQAVHPAQSIQGVNSDEVADALASNSRQPATAPAQAPAQPKKPSKPLI
jgi:hypothetical protein